MPPKGEKRPVLETQYPEITKLLETEDFNGVNREFTRIYADLEKISKNKGLKKSADARKGMRAIEKGMDLLRELLKRKYEIAAKMEEKRPKGKK